MGFIGKLDRLPLAHDIVFSFIIFIGLPYLMETPLLHEPLAILRRDHV